MRIPYYVLHHLKKLARDQRPFDQSPGDENDAVLQGLLDRYQQGEPLSRIMGTREFWSLNFKLSPATLDPRPDSETLIEAALKYFPDPKAPLRILDMGTGSGCLLLSLLHEYKNAQGIGTDINPLAIETAQDNAQALQLDDRCQLRVARWGEGLKGPFHLIISNPPYIRTNEFSSLDENVRTFDPYGALISGKTGLECYQDLMPYIKELLAPDGYAFLEIGLGQAASVNALAQGMGLQLVAIKQDLGGIERCLIFNQF